MKPFAGKKEKGRKIGISPRPQLILSGKRSLTTGVGIFSCTRDEVKRKKKKNMRVKKVSKISNLVMKKMDGSYVFHEVGLRHRNGDINLGHGEEKSPRGLVTSERVTTGT